MSYDMLAWICGGLLGTCCIQYAMFRAETKRLIGFADRLQCDLVNARGDLAEADAELNRLRGGRLERRTSVIHRAGELTWTGLHDLGGIDATAKVASIQTRIGDGCNPLTGHGANGKAVIQSGLFSSDVDMACVDTAAGYSVYLGIWLGMVLAGDDPSEWGTERTALG